MHITRTRQDRGLSARLALVVDELPPAVVEAGPAVDTVVVGGAVVQNTAVGSVKLSRFEQRFASATSTLIDVGGGSGEGTAPVSCPLVVIDNHVGPMRLEK